MIYRATMKRKPGRPRKHDVDVMPTSFRLSERHKFALRFVAGCSRETLNTTMERVINTMANEVPTSRAWATMWDEEESVRMLNLYALTEWTAPTQEQDARAFCFAHREFFWADKERTTPRRAFAVILWPHVTELAHEWKTTRDEDYNAAARRMAGLLKKAKLTPPAVG